MHADPPRARARITIVRSAAASLTHSVAINLYTHVIAAENTVVITMLAMIGAIIRSAEIRRPPMVVYAKTLGRT